MESNKRDVSIICNQREREREPTCPHAAISHVSQALSVSCSPSSKRNSLSNRNMQKAQDRLRSSVDKSKHSCLDAFQPRNLTPLTKTSCQQMCSILSGFQFPPQNNCLNSISHFTTRSPKHSEPPDLHTQVQVTGSLGSRIREHAYNPVSACPSLKSGA